MNYFLKFIESAKDEAVKHMGLDEASVPFSLLSLYEYPMPTPLPRAYAKFFVGILTRLLDRPAALLVCRMALLGARQYQPEAGAHFTHVQNVREDAWLSYLVTPDKWRVLTDVLARHWATSGGHWFFCEYPENPGVRQSMREALPCKEEELHSACGRLFRWATAVAVTFDDNLLDVLIKRGPVEVDAVVQQTALDAGVMMCRDS